MYEDLVKRLHQRIAVTTAGSPLQDDLLEAADAIEELAKKVDRTSHIFYVECKERYGKTDFDSIAFFDDRKITEQQVREAFFHGIAEYMPDIAVMPKKVAQNVFGLKDENETEL